MIRGIIYKYTSPSDKVYIGQTIDERKRRNTFLNLNLSYGGDKIDNARAKYKPENFNYEIIIEKEYITKEEAKSDLDRLEIYYIDYYDSYLNGYNSALGGGTTTGYKFTDEQRQKVSEIQKGRIITDEHRANISSALKGKSKTEEHKRKLSESSSLKKKVVELDLKGNILATYESVTDCASANNTTKSHISDVLNGKRKTHHKKKFIYG